MKSVFHNSRKKLVALFYIAMSQEMPADKQCQIKLNDLDFQSGILADFMIS